MTREYDLFEKFPDGSSLWRASVLGLEGTQVYLRRLAEKSGNRFYAIDVTSGKVIQANPEGGLTSLLTPGKLGKMGKSATA